MSLQHIDINGPVAYWTAPRFRGDRVYERHCRVTGGLHAIGDDRLALAIGHVTEYTEVLRWLRDGCNLNRWPERLTDDDRWTVWILDRRPGRRDGFWEVLAPSGDLVHVTESCSSGYGDGELDALLQNNVDARQAWGWAVDHFAYVEPPVMRADLSGWMEGGEIPVPEVFIDFVPILERQPA